MTGRPSYDGYLRLPVLLEQQHRLGPPTAHDELLFIAMHQVCELWFKVLLYELTDARDRLLAGDALVPVRRLRRCHEIERLLIEQVRLLDTMTPQDFAEFRPALGTASGAQSAQFWEIEVLSGLREPRWGETRLGPADLTRLHRRLAEPTLWDGYLTMLARAGFDLSTPQLRRAAYAQLGCGPAGAADPRARRAGPPSPVDQTLWTLNELTEALIDHDQAWWTWRARHAFAAERQIGAHRGTAGSDGGSYLWSRAAVRFYPELWAARGAAATAIAPRRHR